MSYLEQINEAVSFIQSKTSVKPQAGIILGTGLGQLVGQIEQAEVIDYKDIPHFPISTVESHDGKLIFGELEGKPVVVMQGRFHYYEGYDMKQITFPVRVMKKLGIEKLLISNVSGGMDPQMEIGDIMIISDHINLLPENPLHGKNYEEMGPRFPDMLETYDEGMRARALEHAKDQGYRVQEGVYVSVMGPNLETVAEYKFLRTIGADAVGMSTVPEVIVARHTSIPTFAISIITDLGIPGRIKPISVPEIIAVANEAQPKLTSIMRHLLKD